MIRTLFINVQIRPDARVKYFPVGLGYVMSALKEQGIAFDYLDQDLYDLTEDDILREIEAKKYDLVCMGCIVTGYKYVKSLTLKIKQRFPNIVIAAGNSVATSIPEILLEKTGVDIACLGEGDVNVGIMIKALEQGTPLKDVPGIAFLQGGEIIYTSPQPPVKDISELKMDYSIFDLESYIPWMRSGVTMPHPLPTENIRAVPVNSARGCVAKCTFCYHVFKKYAYRYRSADSITDEIKMLIDTKGINHIHFWDDLTFFSKKQISDFLNAVEEKKLNFWWEAACRGNLFDSEDDLPLIKRMAKNGCRSMGFSLESSDERILRRMNKKIDVNEFAMQAQLLQKGGVGVFTSLVIGYPEETPETIKNTFETCVRCKISPSVGYLLPQPGSEIFDYAVEQGHIKDLEEYLLKLGDRQDLRINLTNMPWDELVRETESGIQMCNLAFGIQNESDNLLKTTQYRTVEVE